MSEQADSLVLVLGILVGLLWMVAVVVVLWTIGAALWRRFRRRRPVEWGRVAERPYQGDKFPVEGDSE